MDDGRREPRGWFHVKRSRLGYYCDDNRSCGAGTFANKMAVA